MKTVNFTLNSISLPSKLKRLVSVISLFILGLFSTQVAQSQCGAGYFPAQINWDNLDYLVSTGNYSGFVTAARANTQYFALGKDRTTITLVNFTPNGENATHTGDVAVAYSGEDAQFTPTALGTMTIDFESEVAGANFTLYDIDRSASYTITAVNAAAVAQTVNVTTYAGSILTVGGTPLIRTITASNTALANNLNTGSATISVAGPVKSIIITCTAPGTDAVMWMSDINGCISSTFPTSYYAVSRPFQGGMAGGQPSYFLNVVDDSVYMTCPTTGKSIFIATDAASGGAKINSVGYDPYNHIMYFVYSLTGAPTTNKTLKKYDLNTGTFSLITNDVVTLLGTPTFDQGVESGAAAFYDGALYFGIEASNAARNSGREHIIWRIDFNSLGNPYRSTQVYATPSDGGGALLHDWSDFVISNGVLYDFDGAATSNNIDHYDLMTGARTNFVPLFTPRQATVDWADQVYEVGANSALSYDGGHVQPYNYNGTVNGALNFQLIQPPAITLKGSWGDAGEAFRPKSDFGDAPASYDPNPLAPATHEFDPLLRLGATFDNEWVLTSSFGATADGSDEDAIGAPPALPKDGTLSYTINNISVFNNTGGNATLIAWLDYNFNGKFDAGEGRSLNIPTNPAQQFVTLTWSSIYVPLTLNVNTFVRFRLTRAANGMTTANMNGWYPDGEVEDYSVLMGVTLPKDILSIGVEKTNRSTALVSWETASEIPIQNFEILRSSNNSTWEKIATVNSNAANGIQKYSYDDIDPFTGVSYYRVKINYAAPSTANKFTEIKSVKIDYKLATLKVQPNPVINKAAIVLSAPATANATFEIFDGSGRIVKQFTHKVNAGLNTIEVADIDNLSKGVYTVRAHIEGDILTAQFIKSK